jgi:hypothetical protein
MKSKARSFDPVLVTVNRASHNSRNVYNRYKPRGLPACSGAQAKNP